MLYPAAPSLTADIQPSATQLLWIGDIYGFVLAGLLITMGNLADRIGRKRLLLLGAGAFGAASVLAFSQYLQLVRGYGPLQAGLALTVPGLGVGVAMTLSTIFTEAANAFTAAVQSTSYIAAALLGAAGVLAWRVIPSRRPVVEREHREAV